MTVEHTIESKPSTVVHPRKKTSKRSMTPQQKTIKRTQICQANPMANHKVSGGYNQPHP